MSAIGGRDVGIDGLSIGISSQGMDEYIEVLRISLLQNVKEQIDDVTELETKINAGWQGQSRDRFLNLFEQSRNNVKDDLEAEYNDLVARLVELQQNYFAQDANMIQD